MIGKFIKQNEGVVIQVIPNVNGDNELISQLISFVSDITDNRLNELLRHKKEFLNFRNIKQNFKIIKNIFLRHPNIISYEIYSDAKTTSFNFWIPKKLSDNFINTLYNIWDGSRITVYKKDYIDFDIEKTQFTQVRFGNHSIIPLSNDKKIDPVHSLISYLETLNVDDKLLIQFIMRPEGDDWRTSSKSVFKRLKNGENISQGSIKESIYKMINGAVGGIFGESESDDEFLLKEKKYKYEEILSKMSKDGININIRIAAESGNRQRSESLISGVMNSLKVLEGDGSVNNHFIRKDLLPIQNKENFYYLLKERRLPLVTLNNSDVWVSDELSKIMRHPSVTTQSNKLERISIRNTHIPDSFKNDSGLRLGYHQSNGKDNLVHWNTGDIDTLMRPTVVISNPGEGKTELLANKFIDWINLGYGAAVIDVADGKLADKIIYRIDPKLRDKVVIIDCNDLLNPPGLSNFNEVSNGSRESSQMLSQMWTEFYVNYFGIDDHHRSKDFIRKSSLPIFSFEESTILEQYLMISNEDFRTKFLEKISGVKRLYKYQIWWENFNAKPIKVKNEETKAILNKFDVLMDNEILKNIICQSDPKIPKFRKLMDDGAIVIIKAGEGAVHYEASRIIGALVLMKFWMAALSRHELDEKDRFPFKVFCDEPQNYITSGNYVKEMLAKSRKYRLGLEFYFQDPQQIDEKDKDLLKLLVNMNPHLMLGKMGNKAYDKHFKHRISPITANEGERLPKYHWIVSMFEDKDAIEPFIVRSVPPLPDITNHDIISSRDWVNKTKSKYSKPVEEVEEDIQIRELSGYIDTVSDSFTGNAASL